MDYFTSDWHLNHDKIIRYSSRPFDNVIQMKRTLLNNINQTLSKKHDKLYMLGDMSLGDKDGLLEFIQAIHSPVTVIAGNHDANNVCNFLRRNGIEVLSPESYSFKAYGMRVTLSHKPLPSDWLGKNEFNIHGHVHNEGGIIKHPQYYDCGVDNNDYKPVSLPYIMRKREILLND